MQRVISICLLFSCLALSGCAKIVAWMDEGAVAKSGAVKKTKKPAKKSVRKPKPVVKPVAVDAKGAVIKGKPPRNSENLLDVLSALRTELSVGEIRYLSARLTQRTLAAYGSHRGRPSVPPIAPSALRRRLAGRVLTIRYDGGRAVIQLQTRDEKRWLWFFLEDGFWRLDLADDRSWKALSQTPGSQSGAVLTVKQATAGIRGTGPLVAVFKTSAGAIRCRLKTADAPRTAAHFIGLARGLIATKDASTPQPTWQRRAVYDGTRFHRVIGGVSIVGGRTDGEGAGVSISDEFTAALRHDRPGVLGLANRGANTGATQFYITLKPAPQLDDRYSIFGLCKDQDVIAAIADKRPATVVIKSVVVQRGF